MDYVLFLFSAGAMSFASYSLGYAKGRVSMAATFRDAALSREIYSNQMDI